MKKCTIRNLTILIGIAIIFSALPVRSNSPGYEGTNTVKTVAYDQLVSVMKLAVGYTPVVTTNAVRFQTETILRLIRSVKESALEVNSIIVPHDTWYFAYLSATGTKPANAPAFMRLAYEHRQDLRIDILEPKTIKTSFMECPPLIAADVKLWWPKTATSPDSFSFIDTRTVPKLKVINKNIITYRIFDFGDMTVCDNVHGLEGRPISGLLGLMFKLIGDGEVVQTRTIISRDGLQIARAYTKKGFLSVKTTVTVYPDGLAIKGIPPNRPDLEEISSQLKERLKADPIPSS